MSDGAELDRPGAIYALDADALDAMVGSRGGGRPVLSTPPASPRVFVSAAELKMLALVDVRAWVGEIGGTPARAEDARFSPASDRGIRIGVASIQGRLSTLLRIGARTTTAPALVCEIESGETVLIEGGQVEATGRFPLRGSGVSWEGQVVSILDVNALYRWVEASVWERSALTAAPSSLPRERG
ncbi:MAG: hypothetical protein U0414_11870 [Polyangiaceae bacterium]